MHKCEFDSFSVRVLNVRLFMENGELLPGQEVEEVVDALWSAKSAAPMHLHLHLVDGPGRCVERPEVELAPLAVYFENADVVVAKPPHDVRQREVGPHALVRRVGGSEAPRVVVHKGWPVFGVWHCGVECVHLASRVELVDCRLETEFVVGAEGVHDTIVGL